jgi:hypothetical protein
VSGNFLSGPLGFARNPSSSTPPSKGKTPKLYTPICSKLKPVPAISTGAINNEK